MTRRLHRSSGWSTPSRASALAAKAGHPSRPAMPTRTMARTSASSPSGRRKAPRGTSPAPAIAERTVSIVTLRSGINDGAGLSRRAAGRRMAPASCPRRIRSAQGGRPAAEAALRSRPEPDLGRRLCRTRRGTFSRRAADRRALAPRAPARRSALGADLPRRRARGGGGGPRASRAADRQSHAAGADRRMPNRGEPRIISAATPATFRAA